MSAAAVRAMFQYRKRYEVTCDVLEHLRTFIVGRCFNTASGMRSHVTPKQYPGAAAWIKFQYRKRYEVTCDDTEETDAFNMAGVSIPQAV